MKFKRASLQLFLLVLQDFRFNASWTITLISGSMNTITAISIHSTQWKRRKMKDCQFRGNRVLRLTKLMRRTSSMNDFILHLTIPITSDLYFIFFWHGLYSWGEDVLLQLCYAFKLYFYSFLPLFQSLKLGVYFLEPRLDEFFVSFSFVMIKHLYLGFKLLHQSFLLSLRWLNLFFLVLFHGYIFNNFMLLRFSISLGLYSWYFLQLLDGHCHQKLEYLLRLKFDLLCRFIYFEFVFLNRISYFVFHVVSFLIAFFRWLFLFLK